MQPNNKDVLYAKANKYAHGVYKLSRKLPKDELYGLTSQLRRAALSVPLNVVEGYARQSARSEAQFLVIAYGSLKESQFLIKFSIDEGYLNKSLAEVTLSLGEEVAKLLWTKTKTLKQKK